MNWSNHLPTSSNAIHVQHEHRDCDRDASTSSLGSCWAENADEHGSSSSLPWSLPSVRDDDDGRDGRGPCSALKHRQNDRYG